MEGTLMGGVGRSEITPPIPIDLVGYSRRWQPVYEVRFPLTATAVVLDDGATRLAIIGADLPLLRPSDAESIRRQVATSIGTDPDHVLLNISHTHAGPVTHIEGLKIGGNQRGHTKAEIDYVEWLPHMIVSAAIRAARSVEPVRTGAGIGSLDLAVNRRERTEDGRTILGWNPEGINDREVGVLRVDRTDGRPLALVVNFACHPVVVGPDDLAVNPDFPGPMRDLVERATGATCLFLQGAGGNVLPLEGFFDHSGPEIKFGERLAIEALHVASAIDTTSTEIKKLEFGSVTPISLYRKVAKPVQPVQKLAVATASVDLPLKSLPKKSDLVPELERYQRDLDAATSRGADRSVLNPLEYHVNWAEYAIQRLDEGGVELTVPAFLQALRIGEVAISAIPGEVFSEIAIQIKGRSPAPTTLFAGYSNGLISYLPTAAEYQYGGYECDYAHHSYGLIEQVAPETESILVEGSVRLVEALWGT
jgi:neutral ceramidase